MDVPIYCKDLPPNQLKNFILKELKVPMLFKGMLNSWSVPLSWTTDEICFQLADVSTTFKVCPKVQSTYYRNKFSEHQVVFETDCNHVEAMFQDLHEWFHSDDIHSPSNSPKPKKLRSGSTNSLLSKYPRSDYWAYADYKYMSQMCTEHLELIEAIDWGVFGFEGRNGDQSTIWIGSEGASTPCHYDTYGCNLVAQLSGRKMWTLFSPSDTERMYPTRVPYEESSVFSQVNVSNPGLDKQPLFKGASPYQIVLCPGDVLFVPFHWWHYVECIEPSVSVNTWIDLPEDDHERVKEAIVRSLVSSFVSLESSDDHSFVNPNEIIFPMEENLRLLNLMLNQDGRKQSELTTADLINVVTSEAVLHEIVRQCETKMKQKQHPHIK